jgi:hypothetical protein
MPVKEPNIKLKVSVAAFHEIASLLEQQGFKPDGSVALTLEKGTLLEHPIDFRLATIRRDCAVAAARAFNPSEMGIDFVKFTDTIFQYVLTGKVEEKTVATEWK